MFEKLSDKTIKTLVMGGRAIKGAAPFLRHPRDMIRLREEGYRRGFNWERDWGGLRREFNKCVNELEGK